MTPIALANLPPRILLDSKDFALLSYQKPYRDSLALITQELRGYLAAYQQIRSTVAGKRKAYLKQCTFHARLAQSFAEQCQHHHLRLWAACETVKADVEDAVRSDAVDEAQIQWMTFVQVWNLLLPHYDKYLELGGITAIRP
jgi:hypothetical protein